MSKRPPDKPGVFTQGLRDRHYKGTSAVGRRLADKAEVARKRRIQWLRRQHPNNSAAHELAKKLETCRSDHRCRSGACPVCAQAAQTLFANIVTTFCKG
jgi:hypothetical protein